MAVYFYLLLVVLQFIPARLRQKAVVQRWREHWLLDKHQDVYQQLYASVDGFALSQAARINQDAIEYTYGEIEFESFIALLSLCNPNPLTVFYDLGSGVGKAVLACAMVFDIKKSCGVELFPSLHYHAQRQQKCLRQIPGYQEKAAHIDFKLAHLLEVPLYDASIIFINATAFFGETWLDISRHVEQINPGAIVISTSKALCSELFTTLRVTQARMSWGIVKVVIQQRRRE
ncbi:MULTISPECIES: hypothetical protein [unclassified Legionella]|uniref:hypothetical protein n=1 Tax=unclassified Legionella TaxID=2622702 RepID=UPI0010545B4E|nr:MULTISPECIES: hypothetical protein [unclassified Legionella]MDI9819514.1 hypothetical protein [Legionella sp. PL877]